MNVFWEIERKLKITGDDDFDFETQWISMEDG